MLKNLLNLPFLQHAFQYKVFYQKEKQISFLVVIHATLYRSQ